MIPTIFPADYADTTFSLHGTADLIDCIECVAEETEDEDGSEWELAFTYPINGFGYELLVKNAIVVAKVNDHQGNQAFRIYSIEKNIAKTVSVKCQHISYDLINIPVKAYKADNANAAIQKLSENAITDPSKYQNRFTITASDMETTDYYNEKFTLENPTSMRAALLDGDNSIKGTYGGDLVFDNYNVTLMKTGGQDNNVTINYGVDLIDLTQEENISEMITGVLGYYKRSTNDSKYSTQPIVYANAIVYGKGDYKVQRVEPVDLSDFFPNDPPEPAAIKAKAEEWAAKEKIGEPEISLTVQYATLGQDVRIRDAICVKFPELLGDTGYKAKVVKYKYNVLLERCEEIEVGHAKAGNMFNLMDASKLRKGLMPPDRIQNESITNNKIARGGVGAGKLAPESVSTGNVELGAIDHNRLSGYDGVGDPAVWANNLSGVDDPDGAAVTNEKIGRGAITGDKVQSKEIKKTHLSGKNDPDGAAVIQDKIAAKAVDTGEIQTAAVTWNRLNGDNGEQPAKRISQLQTDMGYVNRLFASTAMVDAVYATAFSGGSITVSGSAQCAGADCSSLRVRNSGNIIFKGYTFDGTALVTDNNGNLVRVITS